MAKIKYTIRCPSCGGKFSVVSDTMPAFCILCGAADDDENALTAPCTRWAMARMTKYTIRCFSCAEKWTVVALEMPKFCPYCGASDDSDDAPIPSQLNIGGSAVARSVDKMYRDTEASSAMRAEMVGDNSLKITNMRDNLREGDVAAMPVNNMVTQYAEEMHKAVGFNYFQANVSDHVAAAKMGQERTTGQKALAAIQGGKAPSLPTNIKGQWGAGR